MGTDNAGDSPSRDPRWLVPVSRIVAGVVLFLAAVWLVSALITLVLGGRSLATVVVLVVAVVAVGGASALGARSRRWRANPYW